MIFTTFTNWIAAMQPLYLVNTLLGATVTCCMLIVAAGKHRDLMIWACGFALYAISFSLFGLRSELPQMVSVIGGNGALSFMFAMFVEGLARLYRVPISRWFIWLPPMMTLVAFIVFLEDFDTRIKLGVISSSYHSLLVLYLVFKGVYATQGRGRWIIFCAIVFHAGVLLVRSLLIASGVYDGTGFLAPSVEQTFYLSMALSTVVMFAFGLLVVYKERAEAEAWRQAHFDPLTNIGNRRALKKILQDLSVRSRRKLNYCAVILLDLDNFKELNDTYGHSVGDELLILVAQRIKHTLSASDQVIRLGGDEFLILLENLGSDLTTTEENALKVGQRVLDHLCLPYQLDVSRGEKEPVIQLEYSVTASMGIELFHCDEAAREEVMSAVDLAMYTAKKSGKNAICCHDRIYPSQHQSIFA